MKNCLFYLPFLLLTVNFSVSLSAQQQKDKHEALNAYFETIVKDAAQTIYVAKEKINSNETLTIFESNVKMINDPVNNYKAYTKLFNWKDFEKMKKKYKNSCSPGKRIWCNDRFWTKKDFKYNKIIFENMNTTKEIEPILEKYNNFNIKVYGFSEPIYYQNKQYIVFTFNKLSLNSSGLDIIIMRKIKGKWVVMFEWSNPDIFD